ncbi:MAG TPA: rhodanese-like domain-containing protein [Gallionellaceae bacterium]|nr:rhodanese-like domain-containing protein [Gallionellaceae bacterium]
MERTIKPEDLKSRLETSLVLDVRREADYTASPEAVPGSTWQNPEQIDSWIGKVPRDRDVVIYCVRGASVSNSVVDKLQAAGVNARFIEGGIEGWKAAGGKTAQK